MTFLHHLTIWWQLFCRQWFVFASKWRDTLINNTILIFFMSLLNGYFLPALGMPTENSIPLLLGSFVSLNVMNGFNSGLTLAHDMTTHKMFLYHLTLPLPHWAVMSAYVCGGMLHVLSISVPILFFGLLFVGGISIFATASVMIIPMLLTLALFFTIFFLFLSTLLDFDTFVGDVWPRFISPFFTFGAVFYVWYPLKVHCPRIAFAMLLNPFTYTAEGLRSALLGRPEFIPYTACIGVLLATTGMMSVFWGIAIRKRLNLLVVKAVK